MIIIITDSHYVFQSGVLPVLHNEPGAVGEGLVGRHPVLDAGGAARALVRGLGAAHLHRRLLRL